MAARALIDTNVLVYRHDGRFPEKQRTADEVLRDGISSGTARIAHQSIVEFVAATTRGAPEDRLLDVSDARREAEELMAQFPDHLSRRRGAANGPAWGRDVWPLLVRCTPVGPCRGQRDRRAAFRGLPARPDVRDGNRPKPLPAPSRPRLSHPRGPGPLRPAGGVAAFAALRNGRAEPGAFGPVLPRPSRLSGSPANFEPNSPLPAPRQRLKCPRTPENLPAPRRTRPGEGRGG